MDVNTPMIESILNMSLETLTALVDDIGNECTVAAQREAALFTLRMCAGRRPLVNHDPACITNLTVTCQHVFDDLCAARESVDEDTRNYHLYRGVRMALVYMISYLLAEERDEAVRLLHDLDEGVADELRDTYFVFGDVVSV